jgi:hypothetical protein
VKRERIDGRREKEKETMAINLERERQEENEIFCPIIN